MTVAVKAVVKLQHVSGLPEDTDDNTFIFTGSQPDAATLMANLNTANILPRFYDIAATGHPLSWYLSSVLDRATTNPHQVVYYDLTAHLDGSPAGSPIGVHQFGLTAASGDADLPAEVAAVLTLYGLERNAAPVDGPVSDIPNSPKEIRDGAPATHRGRTRPKQSRTGRIYLGPLNAAAVDVVAGEARLSAALTADLARAASQMLTEVDAIATVTDWVIWSRKLHDTSIVVGGHVDNAPDTQHRRGVASTARVLWS